MRLLLKQIHNWLNTKNQRELIILTVASALSITWAWHSWLASPLWQKQAKIHSEIISTQITVEKLQTQVETLKAESAEGNAPGQQLRYAQLLQKTAKVEAELNHYKQQIVTPQQLFDVLQAILKASQKLYLVHLENLPVVALNKDSNKAGNAIYSHPFSIELRGNYFATLEYLQQLEALPWHIYWDEFDYQVKQYPEANVSIKLHILSNQGKLLNV